MDSNNNNNNNINNNNTPSTTNETGHSLLLLFSEVIHLVNQLNLPQDLKNEFYQLFYQWEQLKIKIVLDNQMKHRNQQ